MNAVKIMKGLMALGILLCGFSVSVLAAGQVAKPALLIDAELPFRCARPTDDKEIAKTVVLKENDFVITPSNSGDALPRYAVNTYNFENRALDQVVVELLQQAGIAVQAESGSYPLMNGKNVKGELSAIIKELTEKANVFYVYHASTKTLHLMRRADMVVQVPHNETVLLALLDALRGAEIKRLNVDWEKYQIYMNVSSDELDKARMLVSKIMYDAYLLVAETKLYRVMPKNMYLEPTLRRFGMNKVAMIKNGVVVQAILFDDMASSDDFINAARGVGQVDLLAQGVAVVPNGWNMRFNLGECSQTVLPYKDFAMLMRTRIKGPEDWFTQLTLLGFQGEVATFDIKTSLNQELVLVGVPAGDNQGELVFAIRLNVIRFIKKGDKV